MSHNLSWTSVLLLLLPLTRHAHAQALFSATQAAPSAPSTFVTSSRPTTAINPSGFASANPTQVGVSASTSTAQDCTGQGFNGQCRGAGRTSSDNYYIIFVAIFFVLLVAGLWIVGKRRRKRTAATVNHRRSALARDMQNRQFDQMFGNAARPLSGERRSGGGGGVGGVGGHRTSRTAPAQTRRDEGLNEAGEAPPPYVPKREDGVDDAGLAIPMQTFQRDDRSKPPEYDDAAVTRAEVAAGREAQGTGNGANASRS